MGMASRMQITALLLLILTSIIVIGFVILFLVAHVNPVHILSWLVPQMIYPRS